ncbi:hypothetical protein DAPPUDRAFT_304089 [Daphnia pulex]|uniref:RING-type E3 ubiquitin transferase n=1 Tax=Daphnia pulex TaxID=6669 RepID=E9GJ22_DAPPU|nr:hypothetical protein DAPPUDRAFT_304089 [Daphnia pulex]|eukprot:EFX80560.1 hypothetical protein DAPPUDRAFT_304089 [Daphnia pulex]
MKRYSDNMSPGRWKRICPPAHDSDSDSSSSDSDGNINSFYRRLYSYGGQNCNQCGFPNLVCSCNLRHNRPAVATSSRESMILIDPIEPNERVAGPTGANGSSHASTSGNSSSSSFQPTLNSGATSTGNDNEIPSVSFRASTSIEQFTLSRQNPESTFAYAIANRRRLEMYSDLEETASPIFQPPKLHNFSRSNRLKDTTESQTSIEVTASDATAVEADREANKDLNEFNSRLLSLIECPVCLEPICPPVHQCRRGHLVCGKCKSQLHQCPTCRDKLSEMRNFAVERIAQLLKYPCQNAGLGCPISILLSGKNTHESTCPFRHYQCLFRTCSWAGFQQEMVPHLRSTHPLRFLEGSRQEIDVELNSPTLFYTDWALSCFGRIFRLNVFHHIPNSMFYVSAYVAGGCGEGTPGSAGLPSASGGHSESDYTYTVTVNGTLGRRVSFTRQMHGESTRTSQLCHSEDCFSIRGDKLQNYTRDRGSKLRLYVQLEQLADPTTTNSSQETNPIVSN